MNQRNVLKMNFIFIAIIVRMRIIHISSKKYYNYAFESLYQERAIESMKRRVLLVDLCFKLAK